MPPPVDPSGAHRPGLIIYVLAILIACSLPALLLAGL